MRGFVVKLNNLLFSKFNIFSWLLIKKKIIIYVIILINKMSIGKFGIMLMLNGYGIVLKGCYFS